MNKHDPQNKECYDCTKHAGRICPSGLKSRIEMDKHFTDIQPLPAEGKGWEEEYNRLFPLIEFRDTGAWYAVKEFIRDTIQSEV